MPPQLRVKSLPPVARRFVLNGCVQGVGVRPAIARLAAQYSLQGQVANRLYGVEVVVEGESAAVTLFETELPKRLPLGAHLASFSSMEASPLGCDEFTICEDDSTGPLRSEIPRDMPVCADCLNDVADSANRRHAYPWTSCTNCGPRFSIVTALPYERRRTTMGHFVQCAKCAAEYSSPLDRRFHSQTNGCPACGPTIWLTEGRQLQSRNGAAIQQAVEALRSGAIVALRGMGGYQLLCDATSSAAVNQLRRRKQRPSKPLAVLVRDLAQADRIAVLSEKERELLQSPANPIVVVASRRGAVVVDCVAPGLKRIGLMLSSTPLHWLLSSKADRPLVATSGNREGSPLAVEVEDAEIELAGIADLFLHHDRDISHPVDDSVVQSVGERMMVLRCGRGYAPLPLPLNFARRTFLAVGGEQKSACALATPDQAILGPYVGYLGRLEVRQRFLSEQQKLLDLCGASPEAIVRDLHPDYFTSRWANEQNIPQIAVQHHHAHVAAGILEAGWLDRTVLGIAFDGTGYGPDETIWGGEFLLANLRDYQRVGHLRPFRLPGAEAAIREPWRTAVSLVHEATERECPQLPNFPDRSAADIDRLREIITRPSLSALTTSAGRLFDGVAALILNRSTSEFDGHLPLLLEAMCDPSESGAYSAPLQDGPPLQIDWRPLLRQLLRDDDATPGVRAMRFHRGLARGIVEVVRRFPSHPVILTGGVFQNRVLTELVSQALAADRHEFWIPERTPLNDGGLAAGQLAIAAARDVSRHESREAADRLPVG